MSRSTLSVRFTSFVIAIGTLFLVGAAARMVRAAHSGHRGGDTACSASRLQGGYGFLAAGTETKPGPFISVGRLEFDGKGHVTAVASVSEKGHLVRGASYRGTYSMRPDCTGSLILTSQKETYQSHFDFVLEEDGNMIDMIQTDEGEMVSLAARRQ